MTTGADKTDSTHFLFRLWQGKVYHVDTLVSHIYTGVGYCIVYCCHRFCQSLPHDERNSSTLSFYIIPEIGVESGKPDFIMSLLDERSKNVIEAYNNGDEEKLKQASVDLEEIVLKGWDCFYRTTHPLMALIALYRSISAGGIRSVDSVFTAYYCMLRSFRETQGVEKIEAAIYGFLLLDANMGILQVILQQKLSSPGLAHSTLYEQIILLYMTITDNSHAVIIDTATFRWLSSRKFVYSDIFAIQWDYSLIESIERSMDVFIMRIKDDYLEKKNE